MKKKISVFALLLSLMLAILVPVQLPVPVQAANSTETTADDVKYADVEDFMHSVGYTEFVKYDGYLYMVFLSDEYLQVVSFYGIENCLPLFVYSPGARDNSDVLVVANKDNRNFYVDKFYSPVQASLKSDYGLIQRTSDSSAIQLEYNLQPVTGVFLNTDKITGSWFENLVYSDLDFYYFGDSAYVFLSGDGEIVFESTKYDSFSFPLWCQYAGLNCLASSNESATVIPYSFNSYWHIVRKTSSGNWLLTTIGSTLGQSKMNLRLSDSGDLIIYEFSGDDSFVISVRQYVYDTDGWKVLTYDTYDYDNFSSGLLTLPAGSGIDDTRVLAYTSTDIYLSDGLSVYSAASTEYIEPSVPDVTPEPIPGSGSSGSGDSDDTGSDSSGSSGGGRPGSGTRPSLGGEASGGGGLDFIINLFTLIWTKICAVPMSVDGYSISLQQLFVYGALVSIVGGFIMKFIFRR